jgi:hypothetical protein
MNTSDTQVLETLLERGGVGWLLHEDRDTRLQQIAKELEATSAELTRRLAPQNVDLLQEMSAAPADLKPLTQLFASPVSTEMRAMVYCVLRGMEIKEIDFAYRHKTSVSLRVVLENNVTGQELKFASNVVWDAEVLRHLGIMTMGKKPILHGFYAFG